MSHLENLLGNGNGTRDNPLKNKYEIMNRFGHEVALPLAKHFGAQYAIGLIKPEYQEAYFTPGIWAANEIDIRNIRFTTVLSPKAFSVLSDNGFEGLLYHQICDAFLLYIAAYNFPDFIADLNDGKFSYPRQEATVDFIACKHFKNRTIVDYRVESFLHELDEEVLDLGFFRNYLQHLGEFDSTLVRDIKLGLGFDEDDEI